MVVLCGIAVIIIASLYGGYKKGMVKMVLSCIALLATMIIVGVLSPIVTKAVKNTDSYESVLDSTEKRLVKEGVFKEGNIEDIIERLNVPDEIKNYLLDSNTVKKYAQLNVDNANDYIVHSIANIIVSALVFVVLFIIVYVCINIIISTLDLISKLPLINGINKLGGAVLGAAEGLLLVWLFFIGLNIFSNTEFARFVFEDINRNAVASFIYDNNLILKVVLKLL